jgi:hypothetical protein
MNPFYSRNFGVPRDSRFVLGTRKARRLADKDKSQFRCVVGFDGHLGQELCAVPSKLHTTNGICYAARANSLVPQIRLQAECESVS